MARKTKGVTCPLPGRDEGKVYFITEMSASKSEAWALRALLALVKGGAQIPDGVAGAGLAGVAQMGPDAFMSLDYETIRPLLDEMMACVKIQPNPADEASRRPIMEEQDDIEEAATRVWLRLEVYELHVGFSKTVSLLKSKMETALRAQLAPPGAPIPTSPEALAQ